MNIRWLLRAKRWAQNPPSVSRMKFVFGIIVLCLLLVVIEKLFGWPDALTLSRTRLR